MSKQVFLNKKQREAYVYVCRKLYKEGVEHNISDKAVEIVKKMNSQELIDFIREQDPLPQPILTKQTSLKKIAERYTEYELNQLAQGKQVVKNKPASEITHHKICVISDTHIGSVYSPEEWVQKAIHTAEEEHCEMILHCGDLTEGMKKARLDTQIYEIKEKALGYRKMKCCAIEAFKDCTIPIKIISGNHDKFFQDDADIVEDVTKDVHKMTYLGYDKAVIDIDGAKIMLFHGTGCFSNTRLNNIARNFSVYNGGVQICLCGHVHKFEWKYIEKCHMIHVPSLQECTKFMSGKVTYADTGFLILDFDVQEGKVINLNIKYNTL